MPNPRIAVVIPFYNGSAFIDEALTMLERQTRQPDEVIIVDDGSNEEEVRRLLVSARHHNARVFHQANSGPGVARNRGVAETSCEIIAFLDVDDLWEPEKLQAQLDAFAADPHLDLAMTENRTLRPDGGVDFVSSLAALPKPLFIELLLKGRIHSFTSSLAYRREFLTRIGGFEPNLRFREDHLILLRSLLEGEVRVIPTPLSSRRLHLESMSGAGANPDLTLRLRRAELFWSFAKSFVPNIPLRRLRAFEMERLAKNYIVAGHPLRASGATLKALVLEPRRPKRLFFMVAAAWSLVQPSRFDRWHSGLALMRKGSRGV